jgi:hypothetical protein
MLDQSGSIITAVVLTEQNLFLAAAFQKPFRCCSSLSRVKVGHHLSFQVPGALILQEMLLVIPDPYTRVEVDETPAYSCDAVREFLNHLRPIELGLDQQTTIDRVQWT